MKSPLILFLAFVLIAGFLLPGGAQATRKKNMREFFDERYVTKVHVSNIKNLSGVNGVNIKGLKKSIEDALTSRLSHKFEIVPGEAEADIVINIDVMGYLWTENDPVDMVFSPIAAAADAAKTDNYSRMAADVTVTNAKTGKEMWSDRIQSTITDDSMSEEMSYDMSNERIVEVFLRELFKKRERR